MRLKEHSHTTIHQKSNIEMNEKKLQAAASTRSPQPSANQHHCKMLNSQLDQLSHAALRTGFSSPLANRELGAGAYHDDHFEDSNLHFTQVRIGEGNDTIVVQSLAKPHMYEKSVDHMRFDTVPAVGNGTGMDAMMLPQHRE